ncbi:hypothetical protein C8F04DRAFT_1192809 [Mycena alexandri]|uniref:Uncharacterized protein n=1 Tax=Mycena alexandri TaxID=1745969 RepID=A0AAD6SCB8_9AGAR|nr:hypothetical protein C8F04DRAFT_1192809 [Mycena alexandri]
MAGIMSYFSRPDTKTSLRDALVGLHQQIQILDKKSDQPQRNLASAKDCEGECNRQGMLYSNHGDAREQKSTTPQAALKAACGCSATCLISAKPLATAALRRKHAHEKQLEQLRGQQMQLEAQAKTLASANINAETVAAMKRAAEVMERIHGGVRKLSQSLLANPLSHDPFTEEELEAEFNELESDFRTRSDKTPNMTSDEAVALRELQAELAAM